MAKLRGDQAIAELERCAADPVYFIETYVKIQTPTSGTQPFRMYEYQRQSIVDFKAHRFNIVLKSRQLGYSTVTAAFCLWAAIFTDDQAIVVIATKLATARNFFKKVKFAWDKLPDFFKRFTSAVSLTKTEIEFSNGSFVKAAPNGSDGIRSESLSILVVDEAAFIEGFEELYASSYPVLTTGGRCVILSTPGPIGNKYHQLWEEAIAGKNEYHPTILPWTVKPEQDEAWYKATYRNLGHAKFEREYNCSFDGASENFFSPEVIEKVTESLCEPKAIIDGEFWIWREPEPDGKYIVACDIARGDGGDYSTMCVVDVESGMVVAEDRRHETPRQFAQRATKVATLYNGALIAPEANTFGYMFITTLRDEGYTNVYFDRMANWRAAQDNDFIPERAGFSTQSDSKTSALTRLEEYLDTGFFKATSHRFLSEMRTYIIKPNKNENSTTLKTGAVKNKHDDLIMAYAIAAYVCYRVISGSHAECVNMKSSGSGVDVSSLLQAIARDREMTATDRRRKIVGAPGPFAAGAVHTTNKIQALERLTGDKELVSTVKSGLIEARRSQRKPNPYGWLM